MRLVPVLHNRHGVRPEVRRQFEEFRPRHVAVEYPSTLGEFILSGIRRLPLLSVVHYQEADGAFLYLPLEPTDGQVEALRLALEKGLPVHFVDRDTEGYPLDRSAMPDPYALTRVGHYLFCQAYRHRIRQMVTGFREDALREKTMAYHLQRLSETGERILFVCGLFHFPGILALLDHPQTEVIGRRHRDKVGLAHLHRDSSREILTEMPLLAARYERFRTEGGEPGPAEDQPGSHPGGAEKHRKNSREELSRSQVRVLFKFARNYALLSGGLVPNFYQLIVAARGAVDDNFAYEVWEDGSEYPWQTEEPGIPVMRLSGEDLFLDEKRIRFHRRLKSFRRRLVPVPVRRKKREKEPGEWKKSFGGMFICSYPPEDVVIEGLRQAPAEKGHGDQDRGKRPDRALPELHAGRSGHPADHPGLVPGEDLREGGETPSRQGGLGGGDLRP